MIQNMDINNEIIVKNLFLTMEQYQYLDHYLKSQYRCRNKNKQIRT